MAKNRLEEGLSSTGGKPVIRRPQGLRLSTEEPVVEPDRAPAETQKRSSAKSQDGPKRVNRGYMLREDLIIACKRVALNDGRKLYEVMEDALTQYLSRHSEPTP